MAIALLLGPAWLGAGPVSAQEGHPPDVLDSAYVAGEYRVFTRAGEPASLDDVLVAMAEHDVVFIGENHDDPTAHHLEAELLEGAWRMYATRSPESGTPPAGRARRAVALSLEMFERDAQLVLDEYLGGLITESSFRRDGRPWPRYDTDYRPLVEFAKANGLDVIAANSPRRYATRVTTHGRESLGELSPGALEMLPPLPYGQPSAEYRDQWIQAIAEVLEREGTRCGVAVPDAPAPVGTHDHMGNQLHAQALWDASMAWWISRYLESTPGALVLHVVGGFHVAHGTGTPEHLAAYRPGTRSMIVMLRPVADVETFEPAPGADGEWGDFVIQTDRARTLEAIECRAFGAGAGAGAHPHSLYPHTMHFTQPSAKVSPEAQSGQVPRKVSPGS